jgi:hypothetical protein
VTRLRRALQSVYRRILNKARGGAQQPTLIGISQMRPQEQAACDIAVRMLDAARAEAWDVPPRHGAVDVMLTLKGGRTAAFEVTNLAAHGALRTASLLARDNHSWPLPGQWFWHIEVGPGADVKRLKGCYQNIILTCEAQGITDPYYDQRGWDPTANPDLRWLVQGDSKCRMMGHPVQLASTMTNPHAEVVPAGSGGPVDDSLPGFAVELRAAFDAAPHIQSHFEKLARETAADERHLLIPLHDTALSFTLTSGLAFANQLPSDPPPVPPSITHLWLAPAFSSRVLLWRQSEGWRNFFPYN